jgi:hypothetical protein
LDESVITSLHEPAQFTYPVAHTKPQAPPTHVGVWRAPAEQTVPQSPQLDVSAAVSTQEPPQLVVVGGQTVVQTPKEQVCPGAQALPHAPQLAPSDPMSTHVPLQSK